MGPLKTWVWTMAWRDSRASRGKLFLFVMAVAVGVSALVAVDSFRANVEEAVNAQAKTLLGADVTLNTRQPFPKDTQDLVVPFSDHLTKETLFSSMIQFPRTGQSRLAQVRAIEDGFPYYGSLETEPAKAAANFRKDGAALVDQSLMLQFDLKAGDEIQIGAKKFTIAGALKKVPGEAMMTSIIAPRVYIPMRYLSDTGLIQMGSLVWYKYHIRLKEGSTAETLATSIEAHAMSNRIQVDTVRRRQRQMGRVSDNLSRFFGLTGFVILLLGGTGVASATQLYIRRKVSTVALLQCLGAPRASAFLIYLIQMGLMGVCGAFTGTVAGVGAQWALPRIAKEFLPLSVPFFLSWPSIGQGFLVGAACSLLFAGLPLAALRRISPLQTLRLENDGREGRDPVRWGLGAALALGIFFFSVNRMDNWLHGALFTLGLAASLAVLSATAAILMRTAKKFISDRWPYVWRQGVSNLYRPRNQTQLLIISLGLASGLIILIQLVQTTLVKQVLLTKNDNQPNIALFDIQPHELKEVKAFVSSLEFPILQEVPMVNMRLKSIKGKTVEAIRTDREPKIPRWALFREYKSTYRDHLIDTETITDGEWVPNATLSPDKPVPVSLEKEIAENLRVKLGDTLEFDVHGLPVQVTVASLRKVDWYRVQPNFFFVFPKGVLEEAPAFFVLTSRAAGAARSALLQKEIVTRYPSISTIDLGLVLSTLDSYFSRIATVLRFMGLFGAACGFLVLLGATVTSQMERTRELALLRTLGATRKQLKTIQLVEYAALALLAALTGLIISTLAGWALARFLFNVEFIFDWKRTLVALALIVGSTMAIAFLAGGGILRRPPLETLREETA